MTQQSNLVGKVLHDTHRIKRVLGQGGMGVVLEAEHVRLTQKRFAVKVLHASLADDDNVFARFRREAEIATSLGHPNIVDVFDFYELDDGRPCIVMEYLEGESLYEREKRLGPLPPGELADLVTQLAAGLQAAHDKGIVHRDLKPENIFLVRAARSAGGSAGGVDGVLVKVLDFGISKIRHSRSMLTQDRTLMGTPMYMSPEQGEGEAKDVDHRSDIFSLGSICFEALYGKLPFDAPTVSGIIYQIRFGEPDPGPDATPPFTGALRAVLTRAMAKDKQDRYDRVADLAASFCSALAAVCDGRETALSAPGSSSAAEGGGPAEQREMIRTAPTVVTTHEPAADPHGPPRPSTLGSAAGQLTEREARHLHRGGRRRLLAAVAGLGIVAVVGVALLLKGSSPSPTQGGPSAAAAGTSPAEARAEGLSDAAAGAAAAQPKRRPVAADAAARDEATVELRLSGLPPAARVVVDGEPRTDNPLRLPRSMTTIHRLMIHADGFRSERLRIKADRSRTIEVKPRRLAAARKARSGAAAAARTRHEAKTKAKAKTDAVKKGWIMDPVIE